MDQLNDGDKESFFKREEDRKWRQSVDHQLVTVFTGHQVLDRRLGEIEDMMKEVDELLRGDRTDHIGGLLARIHDLEHQLSKLNAVIFVDSTGRKGILHEVEVLASGERTLGERWKFRTAVVGFIIAALTAILTNLGPISHWVKRHDGRDAVDMAVERAKKEGRPRRLRHSMPADNG